MKLKELFEDITKQFPIPLESEGLDMSKEARYGRAESLGFDIHNVYYHGTIHNFKSFDPRLSDSARNTGTPLGALVLSSNPVVSASYAGEDTDGWGKVRNYHLGGNIMPLFLKKGKVLIVDAKGHNWNDLYIKKYPHLETTNDFAHYAQSKGMDTLIIKNVHDTASWKDKENRKSRLGDTIFVFHPSNVRSINAKFDPANIHSEDLMA